MQTSSIIIGNLTADPELKFLTDGTAKATASIAVNESWTDKDGQKQEKVSYLNIVAWRATAEDLVRIGQKGIRMVVVAKPEQRSWEDKETGAKRSTVEFVASEVAVSARGLESVERKVYERQDGGQQQTKNRPATKRPMVSRNEPAEEPF
jgi:single-strand DNA-binding protein